MISQQSGLEIVGFNGTPLVECGRALPIARRKSDRMCCVFEISNGMDKLQWCHEEMAQEFASEQRWTLFRRSLNVPQSCVNSAQDFTSQPMVVYTNQRLLDYADLPLRADLWNGEYLNWKQLEGLPDDVLATCGSSEAMESLLNHWGRGLLNRFDAMFHLGREHNYLFRIADFALCASLERSLRWKSYLRYTLVQTPEKVKRTFDTFISREFRDVTWDAFIQARAELSAVLQSGVTTPTACTPSATSSVASAMPKLRGIAAASAIDETEFCQHRAA